MGNLHDGHLKLVEEAKRFGRRTVVSIFVNPAQFGEGEDFTTYPRSLDEDLRRLREKSVDLAFTPATHEVYPAKAYTTVTVPDLSDMLCGEHRPGHFSGVATIVAKLFNLVQPDAAVFGEKDFQQLTIIRRMAADLNIPVQIESVGTVREKDGLAMSSRNRYLTEDERPRAPLLYKQICEAESCILSGVSDYSGIERQQTIKLQELGFRPDYFSVRRASDLQPGRPGDRELVILAAAWLGKARLIDNKVVRLP
jgi:pantoate--beta-alanine ligase